MREELSTGARIRVERLRLGLSQQAFGELGGVTKPTQAAYEAGKRVPDLRYLQAVLAAGADLVFIATGVRSEAVAKRIEPDHLRPVAKVLLDWMRVTDRKLSAERLADIIAVLYEVSARTRPEPVGAPMSIDDTEVERLLGDQLKLVS